MIQNAKYVTINTNDNTAAYHWRESNRAVSAYMYNKHYIIQQFFM